MTRRKSESSGFLISFFRYITTLCQKKFISYLLDLALQMQQPFADRKTFGLWKVNILKLVSNSAKNHTCKIKRKFRIILQIHTLKLSRIYSFLIRYSKVGHNCTFGCFYDAVSTTLAVGCKLVHGKLCIDPRCKEGRCQLRKTLAGRRGQVAARGRSWDCTELQGQKQTQ